MVLYSFGLARVAIHVVSVSMERVSAAMTVVVPEQIASRSLEECVVVVLARSDLNTVSLRSNVKPFVDHNDGAGLGLDSSPYVHLNESVAVPNLIERHRVSDDHALRSQRLMLLFVY